LDIIPFQEGKTMDAKIEKCCVRQNASLLEAMRAINDGAFGIALILDSKSQLEGVLTDGDVRRALLKGATLNSPVTAFVNRKFTAVGLAEDRTFVLDLMQSRSISQVPVLSSNGKLVGLHLLREMLGALPKPNWAVIMAGGLGTRLRPITETIPKPMIKVAGRPILERLVLHLVGYGVRQVFISVNYLGHIIEDYFGDGTRFGCRIQYVREPVQMGTGGALSLLPERPTAPLLVLNGDLVTQPAVDKFLDFHTRGGYAAAIAVRRYLHQVPFGCLQLAQSRVRAFAEKPMIEEFINAGAYVISPPLLERIPKQFYPITRLFEGCLQRNEPVGAWEMDGDWLDVGQKEQLRQAQEGVA
jgi:dTDP-glucose pyrophosphorylase/CBS domain-containing protein